MKKITITLLSLFTLCASKSLTGMYSKKTITKQSNTLDLDLRDISGQLFKQEQKKLYAILDAHKISYSDTDISLYFDNNTPAEIKSALIELNRAILYDQLNTCLSKKDEQSYKQLISTLNDFLKIEQYIK